MQKSNEARAQRKTQAKTIGQKVNKTKAKESNKKPSMMTQRGLKIRQSKRNKITHKKPKPKGS